MVCSRVGIGFRRRKIPCSPHSSSVNNSFFTPGQVSHHKEFSPSLKMSNFAHTNHDIGTISFVDSLEEICAAIASNAC